MEGTGRRRSSVTSSSGYDSLGELKTYTLEKYVKLLLRNRFVGSSTYAPTCGNEGNEGDITKAANPRSLMESVGVWHEKWELSGSFPLEDYENALRFLLTISIVPGTTDPRYADLAVEISNESGLRTPYFKGCNLEIDLLLGGTQVLNKGYRLLETTCDKNLFRIYCSINKFCLKKDLRSWCSTTVKESTKDTNNSDRKIEFIQAKVQAVLMVTASESPLSSSSPSSSSVDSDKENYPIMTLKVPKFRRTGKTSRLVFPHHVNEADPVPIEFTEDTLTPLEQIPDETESAHDDESFDESFMCPMGVETMDFYLQFLRMGAAAGHEKLHYSSYSMRPEVNLEIFEFSRLCGISELMELAVDNLIVNLLTHTEIEFMLAVWDMGSKHRILKLEVKALEAIQRKLEKLSVSEKESEVRKVRDYSLKRKLQYSSLVNVTRQY